VKELLHLSEVNNNTAAEYRSLINQVCCYLRALEALKLETPVHELMLIESMLSKLKPADRHKWESHMVNVKSPRVNYLIEFLENKCQTIETIEFRNSNSTVRSKQCSKVNVKSGHDSARRSFVVNERDVSIVMEIISCCLVETSGGLRLMKEETLWPNTNYVLNACPISIWLLNANLEIVHNAQGCIVTFYMLM
jgi:hypothetical protein